MCGWVPRPFTKLRDGHLTLSSFSRTASIHDFWTTLTAPVPPAQLQGGVMELHADLGTCRVAMACRQPHHALMQTCIQGDDRPTCCCAFQRVPGTTGVEPGLARATSRPLRGFAGCRAAGCSDPSIQVRIASEFDVATIGDHMEFDGVWLDVHLGKGRC